MAFLERRSATRELPSRSWRRQEEVVSDLSVDGGAEFLMGDIARASLLVHCAPEAMPRTVAAGAGCRPVPVRPHPLAAEGTAAVIVRGVSAGEPVAPTNANVHDILVASAVTLSFNLTVALELFLHRTPVILFGRLDFYPVCEAVTTPTGACAALVVGLARPPGGCARFLHCDFAQTCLHVNSATVPARPMAIVARAGFDAWRLGRDGISAACRGRRVGGGAG